MESRLIRIVHYGLGGIGSAIARLTTAQRGLEVVGGIDHDPADSLQAFSSMSGCPEVWASRSAAPAR